jgi:hypothetical protein
MSEWMKSRRQYQVNSLNCTNKIIASSKFLANMYINNGVDKDRISIIRQGINNCDKDLDNGNEKKAHLFLATSVKSSLTRG